MTISGIGAGAQASWYSASVSREMSASSIAADVEQAVSGSANSSSSSGTSQASSSSTASTAGDLSATQIQSWQSFAAGRAGGHSGGHHHHHHGAGSGGAAATSGVGQSQMLDQLGGSSPSVTETAQWPMTMSRAS